MRRSRMMVALTVLGLVLACRAIAGNASLPCLQRFVACENKTGAGFFWVDTTCGQVWWAETGKTRWISFGKPDGATPGPNGTYVAVENKAGSGIFVLNATTGEGWWTSGKEWKRMGVPAESPSFAEYQEGK